MNNGGGNQACRTHCAETDCGVRCRGGRSRVYIYGFSLLIRFCTIWWECVYEKVEYKNCYAFFSLWEEGIFSKNRSRDFAVAGNRMMWYTKQKRFCAQFEEEGECYEVSVYDIRRSDRNPSFRDARRRNGWGLYWKTRWKRLFPLGFLWSSEIWVEK